MPIQNVRTRRDGKSTRDSDVRASYRSSNRLNCPQGGLRTSGAPVIYEGVLRCETRAVGVHRVAALVVIGHMSARAWMRRKETAKTASHSIVA
jgi:hypothetical protein